MRLGVELQQRRAPDAARDATRDATPRLAMLERKKLTPIMSKGKAYAHYVYPLRVAPALMY